MAWIILLLAAGIAILLTGILCRRADAAAQAAMDLDAEGGPLAGVPEAEPEPVSATVADEPVPTPEAAAPAPQAGAQGREAVYVYEVRVAEGLMPRFLVEMKRLGTHGRLLRKE